MELPGKMSGRCPGLFNDFLEILFQARLSFARIKMILQDHRESLRRYLISLFCRFPFTRAFRDAEHHNALINNAITHIMDHETAAEENLCARLRILNADLESVRN